jgi:hypothetical protein
MCDPVTATSLALSAAGTYMQSREQAANAKRAQNAKDQAFSAGMTRQQQYADEAGASFNENLDKQGREGFDEKAQQAAEQTKQAFNSIKTPETDYNNMGTLASTPNNVVKAMRDAAATADAKTNRDVNNNAQLQSYGGAMFGQDLDRSQFARLFGNLQDKASRDSALIPLDMQSAATNSQKKGSIIPILLKTAGMAGGMYASANGITSFGDKMVQGPLPASGIGPGAPVMQQGLFTNLKALPSKITGGRLY